MAISQTHFRSISLPSRLPPANHATELEKLKSWQISVNSEAIQSGILRTAELYNSVQEIAQSTTTQKSMDQESLSISVELLDSRNTIRELVQMMRENVEAARSALRRKGLDSRIQNDITSYFCTRKKMNKCIAKSLKTLKNLENNNNGSNLSTTGDEGFIRVLREVYGLTIAIFKCALVFLLSKTAESGSWNPVSRPMLTKSMASSKDHNGITEVGCVDLALNDLQRSPTSNDFRCC